jgi:site-specific DNA-methyltransferase (adenine-specific)
MKSIPHNSIDMICCDLPYGTTACKWDTIIPFEPLWAHYKRIIKDNGAIVLTASQPFTSALVMSNIKMFKYEWIWEKSKCGSPLTAKFKPMSKHENVLVFGNGRIRYNPQMVDGTPYSRTSKTGVNNMGYGANSEFVYGSKDGKRHPKTVQYFQQKWRRQDQLHPTQKPVALFEYLIKTYTNEGDLVLDNCAGSGTTGVACKNLNRNFILIEKEPEYINIINQRLTNI